MSNRKILREIWRFKLPKGLKSEPFVHWPCMGWYPISARTRVRAEQSAWVLISLGGGHPQGSTSHAKLGKWGFSEGSKSSGPPRDSCCGRWCGFKVSSGPITTSIPPLAQHQRLVQRVQLCQAQCWSLRQSQKPEGQLGEIDIPLPHMARTEGSSALSVLMAVTR